MDAPWFAAVRYYLSLAMWITLPAALVFWVVVHPLARFWRRLGPTTTYVVLFFVLAPIGYLCWLWREPVLAPRYPPRLVFVIVGVLLYLLAAVIEIKCRRHLKARILVGVPELSAEDPGRLLTEGIYAHTRNPRYLDLIIAVIGFALITNYRVMHWLALLCIPGLYVVILLEERELRQRFGEAYEDYLRRVPRLVPRSWGFLLS